MDEHKKNSMIYLAVIIIVGIICFILWSSIGIIITAAVSAVVLILSSTGKKSEHIQPAEPVEEDDEPEVVVKNDIPVPYAVVDSGFDIIGCNEEFLQLMELKCFTDINVKEKIPEYDEQHNNHILPMRSWLTEA